METIGRYQIITELGRGGMAVVYRALDPNIGREVALKLMSREFLADPEFHQRFAREARAVGALESTAIVPLHDFGEDKGQPYLVMRLMTGGSLVERLRQGPLSLAEATEMLSRLAEALDEAHAKGIIHRDLKPGNILLDHKGAPYLADFGIVKLLESSSMTSRGAIGTPAYMSPEHFEGEVSAQSDIYALGVILFQMLTGKLPFQARTPSEWLKAHLMDAPLSLRQLNSALPVALEAVIQRALAKKPEQRYRTAGELVADLRQVTTAAPPRQPDPIPAYLVSSTQQSYPLKKGSLTLGRSSTCDIAIDDTLASRRHAVLEFDGQQCMVYDENSANGTFINEQRVGAAGLLFKLGDTFRIGQVTFRLSTTASNPSWSDGPTVPRVNTQAATNYGETVQEVSKPISPPKAVKPLQNRVVESLPQTVLDTAQTKIDFDWVTIPAGEFTMGSDDYTDEKPKHTIYLPEYQIARVPVTNEQWGLFLQDSGYQWAKRNELWKNGLPRGKEKHPVVYVSWNDAMAFCKWAGVRLPTEAEWEKAARGTDGRIYPWGNQEPHKDLVNYWPNVKNTTPVGSYPKSASPYGLLDMAGNVWEWCSSEYKPYPYRVDDGRENVKVSDNYKILRGGSWSDNSYNIRSAYRHWGYPTNMFEAYSFRCVR